MINESIFRGCVFILICVTYSFRHWRTRWTRPPLCIAAMILWAASIVVYVSGIALSAAHLPVPNSVRVLGVLLMIIAFPLPLWVRSFDAIGDYFSSAICFGPAASHLDPADYQPIANPVFASFAVCDLGVVLLTANGYVLIFSLISLFAMSNWVQCDYTRMRSLRF